MPESERDLELINDAISKLRKERDEMDRSARAAGFGFMRDPHTWQLKMVPLDKPFQSEKKDG